MTISKVKIKVLGREYIIKAGVNADYIEKIASYVNAEADKVASKFSGLNREQTIILAAMNIADELFQLYQLIEQDKEQRGDS